MGQLIPPGKETEDWPGAVKKEDWPKARSTEKKTSWYYYVDKRLIAGLLGRHIGRLVDTAKEAQHAG